MGRRLTLAVALLVLVAAAAIAVLLPPRVTCASLGVPEGERCPVGRIEFERHGPFVSVHVDRRLPLRLGIIAAGGMVSTVLLVAYDRRSSPA